MSSPYKQQRKYYSIKVDGNIIGKSVCEKLLSKSVDYKLKFNKHLDSILKRNRLKIKYCLGNIALNEF